MIEAIGRAPITVRDIDARVTVAGGPSLNATSLGEQGYARSVPQPQFYRNSATITLPKYILDTIIRR